MPLRPVTLWTRDIVSDLSATMSGPLACNLGGAMVRVARRFHNILAYPIQRHMILFQCRDGLSIVDDVSDTTWCR